MGGFAAGLLGTVGKGLQQKNAQYFQQQAQEKQRQLDTQWTAMQTAVTTLDKLKRKQDAGQQLTPDEVQQAQQAAGVYQSSQAEYSKLSKGNKPVNEAFQKVGGFVTKMLTSKRNQLGGPQGQPQDGQHQQSGAQSATAQPGGGQSQPAQPSPANKLTAPEPQVQGVNPQVPNITQKTAQDAPAQAAPPSAGKPLTGPPPVAQQASIPALDPKQAAMLYGSPQYAEGQKQIEVDAAQARKDKAAEATEARKVEAEEKKLSQEHKNKLEEIKATAAAKGDKLVGAPIQLKGEDGKTHSFQKIQTSDGEFVMKDLGEPPEKSLTARPTIISSDVVSSDHAKALAAQGVEYPGEDGKPIDLAKIPDGMVLQAIHVAGKPTFYKPRDINAKIINVGNEEIAVSPLLGDVKGVANGGGTVLGQSRVPTQRTSEQIAIDPTTNQLVKNTLRSSSTPQTTGPAGAPRTSAPVTGAPATAKPQGQTPTPQSGDIKGVPLGANNTYQQRVIPVREAITQVIGDPSQPDLKPLQSYIKLADDPKARERLGTALRLTFDGLNQASNEGAHISAAAGPVSVSTGGIGEVFTNMLGVPQKIAEQKSGIIQAAINKLTPEEKEYFDSVMSAYSTIVGLRSLTRASASQSSVAAIERELPIIGVNTTDSEQFADQIQRLSEVMYNGTKGVPAGYFDPALVERIKNAPAEMQKLKTAKPSPNGKLSGPSSNGDLKSKSTDELLQMLK